MITIKSAVSGLIALALIIIVVEGIVFLHMYRQNIRRPLVTPYGLFYPEKMFRVDRLETYFDVIDEQCQFHLHPPGGTCSPLSYYAEKYGDNLGREKLDECARHQEERITEIFGSLEKYAIFARAQRDQCLRQNLLQEFTSNVSISDVTPPITLYFLK